MSQNSAEFDHRYNLWREFNSIGSMTWSIYHRRIKIDFYFNDENIDVEVMPYILNKTISETSRLLNNDWKPNFRVD